MSAIPRTWPTQGTQRTLVLGGNRSGKSAYAEQLAADSGNEVIYIATAQAGDVEMQARIELHRQRRPASWTTVETPLALGEAIEHCSTPKNILLIDCLTVWLSNLLFSEMRDFPEVGTIAPPQRFVDERAALLSALRAAKGAVILVSSEVGMGIVPQGALSRWFADEAGLLNQDVAALCECVVLIAAGLPLTLKGAPC
jgi:adenosylcobinamide kinase/adenosylcobinamide-phosphate guanylyltransferase